MVDPMLSRLLIVCCYSLVVLLSLMQAAASEAPVRYTHQGQVGVYRLQLTAASVPLAGQRVEVTLTARSPGDQVLLSTATLAHFPRSWVWGKQHATDAIGSPARIQRCLPDACEAPPARLVVHAAGRAGEQGNRQRCHPTSRRGTCSPSLAGLENGTADACCACLCGLGAQSARDPERLHLCACRRNGGQSLVKSQRYVRHSIAAVQSMYAGSGTDEANTAREIGEITLHAHRSLRHTTPVRGSAPYRSLQQTAHWPVRPG